MSTSFKKSKVLEYTDYYLIDDLTAVFPVNCSDCYNVAVCRIGDMPVVTLTPSNNPTGWDTFVEDYKSVLNEICDLWNDDGYYY